MIVAPILLGFVLHFVEVNAPIDQFKGQDDNVLFIGAYDRPAMFFEAQCEIDPETNCPKTCRVFSSMAPHIKVVEGGWEVEFK